MSLKHADEDRIQEYLDGVMEDGEREALQRHLDGCETCRAMFQEYRTLYSGLGDGSEFHLPADFSAKVIARVKSNSMGRVHVNLMHLFITFFGLILGINAMLYYYDFQSLVSEVRGTNWGFQFLPQFVAQLRTYTGAVEVKYFYVLLILILLALFDRLFLQSRHRTVSP